MPQHLSEDELRRISDFADRPMYEREPEQLLPDAEEAEAPDRGASGGD